jgi:hypothetical protein
LYVYRCIYICDFLQKIKVGQLPYLAQRGAPPLDEGGGQVEKVAALAMLCTKLRVEERPTMRQVEMTLEGLQSPKEHILHDLQAGTKVGTHLARIYSSTIGNISSVDVSMQYSQEEEFMLSARYP